MKQPLFCVYDSKAAQYLPPFMSMNKHTALRQFINAVSTEGHDFNQHAADYSLWEIGIFDSETSCLKSQAPENIGNAHELLNQLELQLETRSSPSKANTG